MNFSKIIDLELANSKAKKDTARYVRNRILRLQLSAFEKYRFKLIKKMLKNRLFGNTLEIGCDIGALTSSFVPNASQIVLCDKDIFSLECARTFNESKLKKLKFICADIANLPFQGNYFDTIVCFEVLEHLPKEKHKYILSEILRICRGNAVIYLSTPNKISLPGLEGKIIETFINGYKWQGWDSSHKYIYTSWEFIDFINEFLVEIKKIIGYYFLPGSLLVRLPLAVQNILGNLSYILSNSLGKVFPLRYLGFTTIVVLRKT